MISIISCSITEQNAAKFAAHVREVFGEAQELISIVAPTSLAAGYNEGLRRSTGDMLLFCHDDIEFLSRDVAAIIKRHLEPFDGIGVAGTNRLEGPSWTSSGYPYIFGQVAHGRPPPRQGFDVSVYNASGIAHAGMQAMDGLFLVFNRAVVEEIGWDEATYTAFHMYDLDFTFRAYSAGKRLAVVSDIPIIHQSSGDYGGDWKREAQKFMEKHHGALAKPRLRRHQATVVEAFSREEVLEVMVPRREPNRTHERLKTDMP